MSTSTIETIRHDIGRDRADIQAAAGELRREVQARVQRAKEAVDPRYYAREYPWIALGLVIGAGLAIGLSGADRKAATAVVDGTKKAGEAIGDGVVTAKDAVVERFSDSGDGSTAGANDGKAGGGVGSKVLAKVDSLLYDGLHELLDDMKASAGSLQGAKP
jgi:ElaB/YqjD/DUF883 family membrane-anchored ribosome-binding protein